MTHFVTLVVIPHDEWKNRTSYIDDVMERFSESYEIDEYVSQDAKDVLNKIKELKKKHPEYKNKSNKDI